MVIFLYNLYIFGIHPQNHVIMNGVIKGFVWVIHFETVIKTLKLSEISLKLM